MERAPHRCARSRFFKRQPPGNAIMVTLALVLPPCFPSVTLSRDSVAPLVHDRGRSKGVRMANATRIWHSGEPMRAVPGDGDLHAAPLAIAATELERLYE